MQLIKELVRKRRADSQLGRRQLLCAGAGFAAVALPACTVDNVPFFVPPTSGGYGGDGSAPSEGGGFLPGEDASFPSPDGGGPGQPDSSTPRPDGSSGQPDTGGGPVDSGGGGMDTSPPPPTCMQNSNTLVVPLAQHPELGSTGGATILSDNRYSDPYCQQNSFVVVATGPGQYAAFSAGCTHSCCTVIVSGSSLFCPCHGAQFDVMTGHVTQGPARQSLPPLSVCTDGTNLYIQLA